MMLNLQPHLSKRLDTKFLHDSGEELFMASLTGENPFAKKSYLEKLDKIRKGKFIRVNNFLERYKA